MIEVEGDLLDAERYPVIGHGVNLHGLMGAGIAKRIADLYPEIVPEYKSRCANGTLWLGGVWPVSVENGPRIYNIASQDAPGRNARMDALWSGVCKTLADCWRHGISDLALPLIGCGIGGLQWTNEEYPDVFDRITVGAPRFTGWDYVQDVLWHLDAASPVNITIVHYKPGGK